MKLVIGCPIYKRDWILPYWIRAIKSQSLNFKDVGFVFEVSPDDVETISLLEQWKDLDNSISFLEIRERNDIAHFSHQDNGRQWTLSKYENMVSLRNSLLDRVREISPDYYFSLDSDIIISNPNTVRLLTAHIQDGADAVSPLMYMTPIGDSFPSVMSWRSDSPNRAYRDDSYPIGSYFKADVIMAAKVMSKKVYENVDYSVHRQGEDIAWSLGCRDMGYSLYSASYLYAVHVMSKVALDDILKNGDERHHTGQTI